MRLLAFYGHDNGGLGRAGADFRRRRARTRQEGLDVSRQVDAAIRLAVGEGGDHTCCSAGSGLLPGPALLRAKSVVFARSSATCGGGARPYACRDRKSVV